MVKRTKLNQKKSVKWDTLINTNILLADGGDILNEAVSTANSIVKPQRMLTNVLLLEQQILLAEVYIS